MICAPPVQQGAASLQGKLRMQRLSRDKRAPASSVIRGKDAHSMAAKMVLIQQNRGFQGTYSATSPAQREEMRCLLPDLGPRHEVIKVVHGPCLATVTRQVHQEIFQAEHGGHSRGHLCARSQAAT